jgi:hypothetical protein
MIADRSNQIDANTALVSSDVNSDERQREVQRQRDVLLQMCRGTMTYQRWVMRVFQQLSDGLLPGTYSC